ncbi:Cullin-4 [Hondaea fermentalgiana]|uniref:Cullin-4 n=1 Tax=Hondaea fermentalgiana TaxID=2315210 RepID=A0A2R5GJW8_9STRA|nr:Cullin-4 [Hondaea fermentalgiana]|eukprot:GBG30619.1 Cullin-4 [Hondaea fermentalgiana]
MIGHRGGARGSGAGAGGAGGPGAKRLKITLRKARPALPADYLESSWNALETAVRAIQEQRAVEQSREELYHMVEGLCMHKQAAALCTRLEGVLEKHIEASLRRLVGQTPDHAAFLELVTDMWQNYCQQMHSIRSIFLYLDRSYVIAEASLRSIWDIGLRMFRKYLEAAPEVESKVIRGFLDLIARERAGEAVNQSTGTCVVRMLVALDLYESKFEPKLLEETREFYRAESSSMLEQSPVADYLQHVNRRLQEEKQRVARYLDPQTRIPLVRACEKELISEHVSVLLEKGFDTLVREKRAEDLGRMFALLKRVDALSQMRAALSAHVKRRGAQIVQTDESKDKEMVPTLLQLMEDLMELQRTAMQGNEDFDRTIRDAFEAFLNSRGNRPAELIAKYIDRQLRSGVKGAGGEDAVETLLEKVVVLFRFLSAKDTFEAFYKKDLAKRLLLGRSASTDLERSMITKLKTECGSRFTNRLEGMFKDMDISKETMTQFAKDPLYQERGFDTEIHVNVLSTSNWPAYPVMKNLKLPERMSACESAFEKFYKSKFKEGRRLTWQHSLGHCILRADLPGGRKELEVSFYQAIVLLLYNELPAGGQEFTASVLRERTGLEEGELNRTLLSLGSPQARLLLREPKASVRDPIKPTDRFVMNSAFRSDRFRIKINSIQIKETTSENRETHERVQQDRQYQIDAAIVRIMKARKALGHQELLEEIFKQLRFPATAQLIKQRIASLIDREYLERSAPPPNGAYKYMA